MSSVDDRIVNMQFNNTQFQTGAADSTKALQTLEQTIGGMGKSTGLTQMGSDVDGIRAKFSAMQIAGVTALATIVNKAVDAGLQLAKSMTIDPILQGFAEYETNLNSIQTIIANTGEKIGVVNQYLDELNEYSDLTIYNFSQMAENIGRFTAAGVALRPATDAIKGLANTAALSGANVQQLNTAMYQMSQALSSGVIRLMDWRSLENASMGGSNVRNALLATAEAGGEYADVVQDVIKGNLSFRDSLEQGWLTGEVFTKTMRVMAGQVLETKDFVGLTNKELKELGWQGLEAGDAVAYTVEQLQEMGYSKDAAIRLNELSQAAIDSAQKVKTLTQLIDVTKEQIGSGFAQIFERLFGNFEQASKMWTGVSDKIGDTLDGIFDSIDKLLATWQEAGGYKDLWDGFGNIFKVLGNLIAPFVTAFQALTPTAESAGGSLAKATGAFETFTGWLVTLTEGLNVLAPIITAVFSVFKFVGSIMGDLIGALSPVIDLIGDLASELGDLGEQGAEIGSEMIAGILEGFDAESIKTAIQNFATSLVDWIKDALGIASPAAELVPVGEAIVQGIAQGIAQAIKYVATVLDTLIDTVLEVAPNLVEGLAKIAVALVQAIANVLPSLRTAIISIVGTILGTVSDAIPKLADLINTLFDSIINIITTNVPKLFDTLDLILDEIVGFVTNNVPQLIKAGALILLAIAEGIAQNLPVLITYAAEIIGTLAAGIANVIGDLLQAVTENFQVGITSNMNALDWTAILNAILTTGLIAVLIQVAKAFKNFAQNLSGPLEELTGVFTQMQNAIRSQVILNIAIAVGVLAASLIALSLIPEDKLAQGLSAVLGLLTSVTAVMIILAKLDPSGANMAGVGASIALIASGMVMLAGAIGILGSMDLKTLGLGIGAIAFSMGIMVVSLKAMTGLGSGLPAAAAAIGILAGAMVLLSMAIKTLGQLSIADLVQGVTAMSIGLSALVASLFAVSLMGPTVSTAAVAIGIMAAAMVLMAKAVAVLGRLSLSDLAQGVVAMGIGLGMLVIALGAVTAMGPTTAAAAGAIIIMAGAMLIMANAIRILGQLSWEQIAKGIVGLAAAFAVLLVAAAIAAAPPIAAGLAVLGTVMLALGAGAALLGLGLLAAASAFAIFAAVGGAGIAVLVAGFTAFMALLPQLGIQLATAFVTFVQTIAAAAPRLREAFGTIFKEMLGTVSDSIPEIKNLINQLLDAIFDIIIKNTPKIGKVFMVLIRTGLRVLREGIPLYVRTGLAIVEGVLDGMADKLPRIIDAGTRLVVAFIEGIGDASERIVKAAARTIGDFVEALPPAVHDLAEDLSGVGWDIAVAIATGIYDGLLEDGVEMAKEAASALADKLPEWMKKVLGIDSPSKVAHWIGEMFVAGLVGGITSNVKNAVAAAILLSNAVIAAGDKMVAKAQREATKRQLQAERAAAKAAVSDKLASRAEKAAEKKPNNKELQKAAKQARKLADKQAKAAQEAQNKADAAAQKVTDTRAFREADAEGRGDILSDRAKELSDRAIKALAQANAQALAAKKLHGKERKEMLRAARKDAEAAKRLADASKKSQKRADEYYAQSVRSRIEAIRKAQKEEAQALKEQKKFDEASDAEKISILQDRADANAKLADKKQKQSEELLRTARKLAKKDAAKAQRLIDRAEALAQEAKEAADQAKSDQDQAKQLKEQGSSSVTSTGPNTNMVLSRSAMEDAASAIDRYTKSLQQAEEAAAAATPIYQFVQTNTSPVALTDTEIYRQTKNLLSAAEVKMAVNPS